MDEQQAQNTEANIKDNIIKAIEMNDIKTLERLASELKLGEEKLKAFKDCIGKPVELISKTVSGAMPMITDAAK